MPDRILIFQRPIEHLSRNLAEMRELVRRVVIHEVGHYFGLSDPELHKLEQESLAADRARQPADPEPE
jgi:predicted Zn-dependent protease with MMP-like domain